MERLVAEVVEIRGRCTAGLKPGDRMAWEGSILAKDGPWPICPAAARSITAVAGLWLGQAAKPQACHVACLDAGPPYTKGGTTIFRVWRAKAGDDR